MTVSPQPGDFGLVTIDGNVGALIRLGQWLNGDGFSNFEHAFIYIGHGQIVEAEPGGARIAQLVEYEGRSIRWSTGLIDLTDQQRTAIIELAVTQVGTPYSFLDYFAIATKRFHLPLPFVTKRVLDSKHLICSQLVAEDYDGVGLTLGSKPAYLATPGYLDNYLTELEKGKKNGNVSEVGQEQH